LCLSKGIGTRSDMSSSIAPAYLSPHFGRYQRLYVESAAPLIARLHDLSGPVERENRGWDADIPPRLNVTLIPPTAGVRAVMKANRRRDTKPEVALRRILHGNGARYRVDYPVRSPGRTVRVDIAFTRFRLAIFVDGCFWHGCPMHGTRPRTNAGYWIPKIEGNIARDAAVDAALSRFGWTPVRVWEHERPEQAASRIISLLRQAGGAVRA